MITKSVHDKSIAVMSKRFQVIYAEIDLYCASTRGLGEEMPTIEAPSTSDARHHRNRFSVEY